MACAALFLNREGFLAPVVTSTTGFALFHGRHSLLPGTQPIGKNNGMTLFARIIGRVLVMAEDSITGFSLEGNGWRFIPLVAGSTVTRYRETGPAVVTGAARLPLLHCGHAHG